uniref:Pesticidal crystal protein cry6Aa n=1 Tax=Schizophyllum commune TaxID=5334 RepID=A0A508SUC6_SCHCO|nr:pesticidal crystal protein cry6Aa [Schizophyllum commune]
MAASSTFEPKGLLNSDDNYILQHDDVVKLLKYVWAGVLLPVTEDAYRSRLQVSDDVFNKLSSVIKPLVQSYATVDCHHFPDTCLLISIRTDASALSGVQGYDVPWHHQHRERRVQLCASYAQNAGGSSDDSFYAAIFQYIRQLANDLPQDEETKLRETIKELVDMEVKSIDKIYTKSQSAIEELRAFEDDTKKDKSALTERSTAVNDKLQDEVGSLDELERKLQQYRDELEADLAEYEHDKIVACTTPAYYWIGLIGLISAAAVAGIYGDKAAKMAARIDEVRKLISDYEQKIKDETRVVGDLRAINNDVGNILSLIEPSIAVIETMMGIWQAISDDLKNLQEMVDTNVRDAAAVVADRVEAKVVQKWNDLKEAVDKYRKAAYVSDVDSVSLDDLSKQLHEQAVN